MSYDFNSDSKSMELPNPYTFSNLITLCSSTILICGGLYALWLDRGFFAIGSKLALPALLVGVLLCFVGIVYAATALRRLRFYFGRGRPDSLAPEIAQDTYGSSAAADSVKSLLREGVLIYREPHGALENLLYHRFPQLLTAPRVIQDFSQTTFVSLMVILAALLSYGFAVLSTNNLTEKAWVHVIYTLLGGILVLRPVLSSHKINFGTVHLIVLILAAILLPVLIQLFGAKLPDISDYVMGYPTWFMLLSISVIMCLLFVATLRLLPPPPATRVSCIQERSSMQCPPAAVMQEVQRHLQTQWTERIPNRRYALLNPETPLAQESGNFIGEILEETQPIPMKNQVSSGVGEVFSHRAYSVLAISDIFCFLLVVAGVVCSILFLQRIQNNEIASALPLILLCVALILVSRMGLASAARLWGNFSFESIITWVEMQGSFQVASIGTGNQLSSQMQTNNKFVRVENMTLRVWRTRVESLVFGKDAGRQIVAMFSTDQEAKALESHISQFAASQSVLSAPQSSSDQNKLHTLRSAEQQLGVPTTSNSLLSAVQSTTAPTSSEPIQTLFCSQCGAKAVSFAKFCSACGKAMN